MVRGGAPLAVDPGAIGCCGRICVCQPPRWQGATQLDFHFCHFGRRGAVEMVSRSTGAGASQTTGRVKPF